MKTERGFSQGDTLEQTRMRIVMLATQEFPFDEPFINSGNITILTVLKKVKQVTTSATYEHAGKNTKYPFCS